MSQTITTAAAQVGNGRTEHRIRTDAFHMNALCGRVSSRQFTDREAAKLTAKCKGCVKAEELLLAPAAEPAVEAAPVVEAPADADEVWAPGHCTPMMGGAVHEVTSALDGSDGGPVQIFPLCRTGSMTNQGTRYRKVTAELTCRNCIGNRDRRRAAQARRAAEAAAAVVEAPAAAKRYRRTENGMTTYLTQAEGEAEIERLRAAYARDEIRELFAGSTGATYTTLDGLRIHLNLTVEAPAVEDGPQVHRFTDTDTAYDITQTDEGVERGIRDGDVLVVESESVVGVLTNAWPVALTEAHGQFHLMSERYLIREMNDGRYAASAAVAERVATELGLSLLPQHRAPLAPAVDEAPDVDEAPAFVKGERVVCADGMTRTVDHMKRYVADEPKYVVMECGALWIAANCRRAEEGEAAPAVEAPAVSDTYREAQAREAAALARNQQVTESARVVLLHAGHVEAAEGRAGFLFRTNWLSVQLYAVDAAGVELTGYPLDDAFDALTPTLEAQDWYVEYSKIGYHGSSYVLTAPHDDQAPAPADEEQAERTALLIEIGARLSAGLVWSTAAAFQPVHDGEDGPTVGWTYRIRSGSEIRYGYVAARGRILEGFTTELRNREAAERELVAHYEAGTDAAELMPPVATYLTDVLASHTVDQLTKCLHTFNVDVVKTVAEGPGRLIVTRGPDFLGTIYDAGSKSRRGRYEAWSPYAGTRHNLVGFYATVEEATGRIAHAWPVAAWELADETGVSVADVLAAAHLLAAEVADDCVKVLLRIPAATGPDQKITRSAAAVLRDRLTAAREVVEPAAGQADELDEEEARQRVTGSWPGANGFEAERAEDGRLIGYTFQVGSLHAASYGWITAGGTFSKGLEPYRSHAATVLPHAVRDEQAARR